MTTRADERLGMEDAEITANAERLKTWAERGDVYAYVIAGAKERNPAAAMALMEALA
jgi:uncharacterized protein YecE (DUF72 family)